MNTRSRRLAFLSILAAIVGLCYYFNLGSYITLANIKEQSQYLKELTHQNYLRSVIGYLAVYAGALLFGIPAVAPMSILGGYLFGTLAGTLFAVLGAMLGAIASFLMIRHLLNSFIRSHYQERFQNFNERVHKYGSMYLLILHLMAIVPFVVINALAAVTDLHIWTFIWTTIAGSTPLIFVYAMAGDKLGEIESIKDIFSIEIVILLVAFILLALLPMVIRKIRGRRAVDTFEW